MKWIVQVGAALKVGSEGGGLLGMIADKYSCIPMDKCIN